MTKLVTYTLLFVFWAASSMATSVSNVTTDPMSPQALDFGDQVSITFDYDMMGLEGRIFARPFTGSINSPNRSASGSGVFSGMGSATVFFTILDNGQGFELIDQIRFQIVSPDQSTIFSTQFFDVEFAYGTPPAVPLPASVMLLLGGLLGLRVVSRAKA